MVSTIKSHTRLDSATDQYFKEQPAILPKKTKATQSKGSKHNISEDAVSKKSFQFPKAKGSIEDKPKPLAKRVKPSPAVKKESPKPDATKPAAVDKPKTTVELSAIENDFHSKPDSIKALVPRGFELEETEKKVPVKRISNFEILANQLVADVEKTLRQKIHNHHHACTKDPLIEHNERNFWICAEEITFETHALLAKLHKRFELLSKNDPEAAYQELAFRSNEQLQKAFNKIERLESIWAPVRLWRWLRWDRPDPDLDLY